MKSGSFHFLAGVFLILGLMLFGRPVEIYAIDGTSGYDSVGNYIDEAAIDEKRNQELAAQRLQQKHDEYVEKIKNDPDNYLYHGTCIWRSTAPMKPSLPSRKPCSSNPGTERFITNWEKPTAKPRTAKRRSNISKQLTASSRKTSTCTGKPRPATS